LFDRNSRQEAGFFMERKERMPEPEKLIDKAILAIIVRWQIMEVLKKSERREFINNMNA